MSNKDIETRLSILENKVDALEDKAEPTPVIRHNYQDHVVAVTKNDNGTYSDQHNKAHDTFAAAYEASCKPAKPPAKPANWHPDYVAEFMKPYQGKSHREFKALESRARELFFNGQKYAHSQHKPAEPVVPLAKVKVFYEYMSKNIEATEDAKVKFYLQSVRHHFNEIFAEELARESEGGKE